MLKQLLSFPVTHSLYSVFFRNYLRYRFPLCHPIRQIKSNEPVYVDFIVFVLSEAVL